MLKIIIVCIVICCNYLKVIAQQDTTNTYKKAGYFAMGSPQNSSKAHKEAGYFICMGTGTAFLHDHQRAVELFPQMGFYIKNFIMVGFGIPYLFDTQQNRLQERIIGGRLYARVNLFRLTKKWNVPATCVYTLQEMEVSSLYSNLVTLVDGSVVRVLLRQTVRNYTNFNYNTGLGITTRFGAGFSLLVEGLVNIVPHKAEHRVYGSPFAARAGIYYGF